jgi:DNA processing protein
MQLPQISSIQLGESGYPELLARSPNPPRVLYIVGNRESLPGNCVSVVGSRKSTRYGERVVDWMVPTLVKSGLTIVSGLAYGIDALAHKYALEGGGRCVAVLGSGLDIIYPSAHRRLFLDIIEAGGCIVSEYPPGTPPLPHHFPQRNRIVAGLSKVVLIVEATSKSGTLSTANWAVEAGRDVCVCLLYTSDAADDM